MKKTKNILASAIIKAAAVQISPVLYSRQGTVEKVVKKIRELGKQGVQFATFPKTIIPYYPYFSYVLAPFALAKEHLRLLEESVTVPSTETRAIGEAAKEANMVVSIGVNERDGGSIYNTQLLFDADGTLIQGRRKLTPTYNERILWGQGDGSGLRAIDSAVGRIGQLACWEHNNPLARYAMIADGEQIHSAMYPGSFAGQLFAEQAEINVRQHALESACFVVCQSVSKKINHNRRYFLTTMLKTIVATQLGMIGCTTQHATSATAELPIEGELPSLVGAIAWLNSQPLTVDELRGKVVLINFWTYTCINWLRQLPYVRAWAHKYKEQGLVVIGVHTPEFEFEKNIDNVRLALTEMKIDYPIAVDNDYAVWRAFENHYWPALYFIDTQGRIRHHQFGEGEYEQSERIIQQLLSESRTGHVGPEIVEVDARGLEATADWGSLRSPENYLGYERTENFASPGGAVLNKRHLYTAPAQLKPNQWALSGDWTIGKQAIVLNESGGRIAYCFHARDLHLVMGPAERGTSVRFRVLVDGQPAVAARGLDVDVRGEGTATEQRLYQLVRQPKPISDRQFEIEFLDSGVEAFAFTFG